MKLAPAGKRRREADLDHVFGPADVAVASSKLSLSLSLSLSSIAKINAAAPVKWTRPTIRVRRHPSSLSETLPVAGESGKAGTQILGSGEIPWFMADTVSG